MRKIVILDGYTLNPGDISWAGFEAYGEVINHDRTDPEEVTARMAGAEIVLTNKTVISRDAIAASPDLRYIGVLATGVNIVDLDAAADHGVTVTNVPAYGPEAVSQYAFALLLEIVSQVGLHSDAVLSGQWETAEDFAFTLAPLLELTGKTCGIIGLGAIGRQTARVANAFGMRVLGHDPYVTTSPDDVRMTDLDTVLGEADILFLHCPLTDENAKMINGEAIDKMKDGVILINNARGGLLDEAAVADALNRGKIYAAGVDTVSVEPILADNPLLKAKHIFITPHISWAAYETRDRLMGLAVENVARWLAGDPINVVCP